MSGNSSHSAFGRRSNSDNLMFGKMPALQQVESIVQSFKKKHEEYSSSVGSAGSLLMQQQPETSVKTPLTQFFSIQTPFRRTSSNNSSKSINHHISTVGFFTPKTSKNFGLLKPSNTPLAMRSSINTDASSVRSPNNSDARHSSNVSFGGLIAQKISLSKEDT